MTTATAAPPPPSGSRREPPPAPPAEPPSEPPVAPPPEPLPEPPPEPGMARSRPNAVHLLDYLLRLLFREPYSLDIITINDIMRLYPLTGLGGPAMAAFEQSRRIVRSRGDYSQAGLGEFHIGLIYFNWDDYRAAANQFAQARQAWSLDGDYAAMCLSHYAQGLALFHAFHNEAAMMQFGRAERLMRRPAVGPPGQRMGKLAVRMAHYLKEAQDTLRALLWPEENSAGAQGQYLTVPPAVDKNVIYGQPPATTSEGFSKEGRQALERGKQPGNPGVVPRPISNLPDQGAPRVPVPGHATVQGQFNWYQVTMRSGDFLPTIPMGTWLLADQIVGDHPPAGRQYVIIGSHRPSLGRIAVQPLAPGDAPPFCYLGYRRRDEASGWVQLFLDGSARSVAAVDAQLLAVVVGLWYDLMGFMLPED